ncbi:MULTISPECIES: transglycosylase domain-containing protein [unclassified Caulobacter]|uniref:transglycosylase domain-containing protein n=1 Tax=unclassified Caulobacter TaxID=2648921 RepID=UPI000D368A3E|nr:MULTISPECIES: penicillin-binding protein 1A [unclassified Caulobacter]PTS81654.1 penicillin-binding protein [Caulobacter sp. HMWF009]PTT04839.1 penicillin-binding protein [Caulobacter sp. HMWF025]
MANGTFGGNRPAKPQRTPLQALLYWTTVLGVWGLIFIVAFFAVFASDLPDTSKLYDVKRQPSINYLDRSGALLAVRGSQYAPPVDIDALPEYVPAAFVAIEDRQFYRHFGFNPWGIIRSVAWNLTHDGPQRGGSTITQQLARNLFLSPAQNYRRKAQELILAVWLELKFSKKQILALYMNRVYFGAGAYGIEAASQRYFNKPASQLTIGESALLAGMMKGPARYSPVSASERAARRATVVLDEMVRMKAITSQEMEDAIKEPVRVSATLANQRAQYFTDYVDAQVRSLVGEPTEDLVVETTLDLPIQVAAERSVKLGVEGHLKQGVEQAALVAIDGEGRIRAYVGGADYAQTQFDRATTARRQAGSAFKPFVYLTAMEQGRTPSVMVVDEPVKIGTWEPKNYTNKYLGPMTLETALAQSINTVAARLANEVGTGNVAQTARRLGIASKIQLDPSMALGAVEVSPMEMAQAYAPFSNGGFLAKGYGIERIRTASGKVLYDHSVEKAARPAVIGSPALQYMNQMMRQVVQSGTGTRARVGAYDVAGKTGTTSDYRDAWFVGYSGGFVAAVWTGKDDNTPMKRVTGGGAPAEIWHNFMAAALPRLKSTPIPGGTVEPPPPTDDPIGDLIDPSGVPEGPSAEVPADSGAPPAEQLPYE